MKRVWMLLALAAFGVAADKPDFSGVWKLNVSKSDFGSAEKPVSMTVVSKNEGTQMHSTQSAETAQGPQTTEFTWYLDGKRHATDKPVPGYSITKWDDNALVTQRQSSDGAYKVTIRMTLSADGKVATEEIDTKNPGGTNKEKLIWERQ